MIKEEISTFGVAKNRSLNMLRNIVFEHKPHFIFFVKLVTVFFYKHVLFFEHKPHFICFVFLVTTLTRFLGFGAWLRVPLFLML